MSLATVINCRFNTQPRGGGCQTCADLLNLQTMFQHTAARRRLLLVTIWLRILMSFNTQPRGGGCLCHRIYCHYQIRFNTQPRGGGCPTLSSCPKHLWMFQHTAARRRLHKEQIIAAFAQAVSTHSRAEAAASETDILPSSIKKFQHTAARRRLRRPSRYATRADRCFNTQPRGGGCY